MIIELRVGQQGVAWEDIAPVLADIGESARLSTQTRKADTIALALAKGNWQEVRWNFQGRSQGYYVGGIYKLFNMEDK